MTRKEISVLFGLLFSIIISLCSQDIKTAEEIQNNTLRLHIIANSNSAYDQQTKLAVRDEILKMNDILSQSGDNFDSAVQNTNNNLQKIEKQINDYLNNNKVPYNAVCSVEDFIFDTTQYSGFTLPKGQYTALTVRLGDARGKNWWCVLYPALCSTSCGEIALAESSDFIKTDRIMPRFKVVEIYEDIKQKFVQNKTEQYKNIG